MHQGSSRGVERWIRLLHPLRGGLGPLTLRSSARIAGALFHRPDLWSTALVELRAFGRDRRGRLRAPDPRYLAMRAETAYGSTGSEVMSADVVSWLEWCRRVSRSAR